MLDNVGLNVIVLDSVDTKTAASTVIGTTDNGTQRFVPLAVIVECLTATAITTGPVLSVGTNGTAYNNIFGIGGGNVANVTAVNEVIQFLAGLPPNPAKSVAPATDIYVKVNTVAVGTAQTVRVSVIGYYV